MDAASEEYGENRFTEIARRNLGRTADEVKDAVLADVQAFRGNIPANDDLTLVVIRSM